MRLFLALYERHANEYILSRCQDREGGFLIETTAWKGENTR